MKYWWVVGIGVVLSLGGWWWRDHNRLKRLWQGSMVSPIVESEQELPYARYAFPRLVNREDGISKIEVEEGIFSYLTEGKRVTGAITRPTGSDPEGGWPVVVMLRGYVDKEEYVTGMGTKNAAVYFTAHGYVTLAPDFLGYGGSDPEDENVIGARVARPATALDLLASLPSLDFVDPDRVYLWGHSNGGQIALSVLEVLGKRGDQRVRGATLWAPVSKPFPYSILYYTDEAEDRGKMLRKVIAKWEEDYDADDFSIDRYWDWITTPVQIHQGTADDSVPREWSDELVESLKEKGKEVTYYIYPGADHNMRPGWETVVARDVEWFAGL